MFGVGRETNHKGATKGNLEDDETIVGKYTTMHFSKPIQLCNTKTDFTRYKLNQTKPNKPGSRGNQRWNSNYDIRI